MAQQKTSSSKDKVVETTRNCYEVLRVDICGECSILNEALNGEPEVFETSDQTEYDWQLARAKVRAGGGRKRKGIAGFESRQS